MPVSHVTCLSVDSLRYLVLLAGVVFAGTQTRADTYLVGSGAGCTHATLQSALAAAENHAGADSIRLTRSQSYTEQAVVISTAQSLEISGGFATCSQAENDGIATILDGGGGAAEPVLRVTANAGGQVQLRWLTIRGGDEDGTGEGGGILFRGSGTLDIADSTISGNLAGYGGGIYAEGTGTDARLLIGRNVLVLANTARYSGGGIYIEGIALDMDGEDSLIAFNTALASGGEGGYGGGLTILSSDHYAVARINSAGSGNLGVIYSNHAKYGGGVAVVAADDLRGYAELKVSSPDPQRRTAIRGNFASVAGGAIYARPDIEIGSILVEDHNAWVRLDNCDLIDNAAADGAAVYLDGDSSVLGYVVGAQLWINAPFPSHECAAGIPCGGIIGNETNDGIQSTNGAIIRLRDEAGLHVNNDSNLILVERHGLAMQGNRGGRLIYASEDAVVNLVNVLMTGNEVTSELLRFAGEDNSSNEIRGVTIADNSIGSGYVIDKFGDTLLKSSIIWQPGKTSLHDDGGALDVQTVIASEVQSLDAGPEAIVAAPRFVDPARGDYGLRAASPAVDAAIGTTEQDQDANDHPRDVDLPFVENSRGPRDIGAFERQTLDPLVLNGEFDVDTNLWAPAGIAGWDGTQNAAGGPGSGAIKVTQAGTPNLQRIYGLSQCIHLPGPGIYALNGWGRAGAGGVGNRDYVYLNWEYRRSGGEPCDDGAADASGDHFLSNSSNWQHPTNAKLIAVAASEWTHTSSIRITQVVVEFGVTNPSNTIGWFDGITLAPLVDEMIFRNGFDDL